MKKLLCAGGEHLRIGCLGPAHRPSGASWICRLMTRRGSSAEQTSSSSTWRKLGMARGSRPRPHLERRQRVTSCLRVLAADPEVLVGSLWACHGLVTCAREATRPGDHRPHPRRAQGRAARRARGVAGVIQTEMAAACEDRLGGVPAGGRQPDTEDLEGARLCPRARAGINRLGHLTVSARSQSAHVGPERLGAAAAPIGVRDPPGFALPVHVLVDQV